MNFQLDEEEISIPVEAIEYIEKKLDISNCRSPLKFEILEIFFEWLSMQGVEKQKSVLRKALEYGRRGIPVIETCRE